MPDAEFNLDEGESEDGESGAVVNTPTKLEYSSGFPVIPDPDTLTHKEMQAVLREFMTFHYREYMFSLNPHRLFNDL